MFRGIYLVLAIGLLLPAYAQEKATDRRAMTIQVPVLVQSKSGELAYGLAANDFSLQDNGVTERFDLLPTAGAQPLALVLVVQTGHEGKGQLDRTSRLPDLLNGVLTNPKDQTAIVSFDSSPRLVQPFTTDQDVISESLASLKPGDNGAALFDALHLAMLTMQKAPQLQKVVLLISGEQDHGSVGMDFASLVPDIVSRNVSVYSLCFKAGKREPLRGLGALNPLALASNLTRKNAGQAMAELTGGDFDYFNSEREFEERVSTFGAHVHNRYELVFQPEHPQHGLHTIEIHVQREKVEITAMRRAYWVVDESATLRRGSGTPHCEGGAGIR
jgi:VWFA-related protein